MTVLINACIVLAGGNVSDSSRKRPLDGSVVQESYLSQRILSIDYRTVHAMPTSAITVHHIIYQLPLNKTGDSAFPLFEDGACGDVVEAAVGTAGVLETAAVVETFTFPALVQNPVAVARPGRADSCVWA